MSYFNTNIALGIVRTFLIQFNILKPNDSLSRDTLADKIYEFQKQQNITQDGLIGPETLWTMQFPFAAKLNYDLVNVSLNKPEIEKFNNNFYAQSFNYVKLREDVAKEFENLLYYMNWYNCLLTSSGGIRSVRQNAGAHQSSTSYHYPGIAFDLNVTSGFFNPEKDPFVIVNKDETKENYDFEVWARAGFYDFKGFTRKFDRNRFKTTLNNVIYWDNWNSNSDQYIDNLSGYFINFTSLANHFGFKPISPGRGFTNSNDKNYIFSDWWHFQYEKKLIPNFSQFGIELLKIGKYTFNFLDKVSPVLWKHREKIFQYNWF